jgi:hypothetical protein
LLRGYPLQPEIRTRTPDGKIITERAVIPAEVRQTTQSQGFRRQSNGALQRSTPPSPKQSVVNEAPQTGTRETPLPATRIYPYGVARNRLTQASKRLGVPAVVVNDVGQAEILVTLRSYYRKRMHPIVEAEHRGLPIYVLRSNTVNQMVQFLTDLFNLPQENTADLSLEQALQEAQGAINAVLNGERWVDLPPASAYVRRLQHQMAREAKLISHSLGKEPYRRVRIYRE